MRTLRNPVHPAYFADPYVLHAEGRWWALGTGGAGDVIAGLVSDDLLRWEPWTPRISDEARHLAGLTHFWAPELVSWNGRYHLYFSAGVEDRAHRILVADGPSPKGPFENVRPVAGLDEAFAIDPHVLETPQGHYLFYAADRFDGARVGTAVVVRTLLKPDRADEVWNPVITPSADWQIYERGRAMHGNRYDWHTCEGPFVTRRGGRYWCLYSGGSWKSDTYGMGAAWAENPDGPWHDVATERPTVIRTLPGRAIGPGHASVITDFVGVDWLVYHAWDAGMTARRMCFDRLTWEDGTPVCLGPTIDAQPAPIADDTPSVPRGNAPPPAL